MKIIPNSDILVDGKHAERGTPVDTNDANARALVAQGLAKVAAEKPAAKPIETAEAPAATTRQTAARRK